MSSEIYKIEVGHHIDIQNLSIYFASVTSDSRCPKEVNCVQAGEALVNIEISEKRVGVIKKTVTFTPTVCLPGTIYRGDDFSISGLSLDPYPIAGQSIDLENYTLKLLVSKTQ